MHKIIYYQKTNIYHVIKAQKSRAKKMCQHLNYVQRTRLYYGILNLSILRELALNILIQLTLIAFDEN